jgi:hypothetical protein
MKFPFYYTLVLFLTFILLLFVFYINYKINIYKFIGKLNKNLYIYSTILCIIGFLITYYYILLKNNFTKYDVNKIFITILLILLCTILWIISSYYKLKILNILFISILCIVNFYLFYIIKNLDEDKYKILKNISVICILYLLFHHVVIDLFMWNYYNYYT